MSKEGFVFWGEAVWVVLIRLVTVEWDVKQQTNQMYLLHPSPFPHLKSVLEDSGERRGWEGGGGLISFFLVFRVTSMHPYGSGTWPLPSSGSIFSTLLNTTSSPNRKIGLHFLFSTLIMVLPSAVEDDHDFLRWMAAGCGSGGGW